MDLYAETAYQLSRELTLRYSTSFGQSSKLFSKTIQPHIYAIYGLVRIADEIVDTYVGPRQATLLKELEDDTYQAMRIGYSANPIVHAFALTANQYGISKALIKPFFESMRLDLKPQQYTTDLYAAYIYGSAEVIGLMCLRVFTDGNAAQYKQLAPGAKALGAAYQKVNFLRDIASDHHERGRMYFPDMTFETFDEAAKAGIIADIESDFSAALPAVHALPANAQKAVELSYRYYMELLKKLKVTPASTIKTRRIRVSNGKKISLMLTPSFAHRKRVK